MAKFLLVTGLVLLFSQFSMARGGISSGSPVEPFLQNVDCGAGPNQADALFVDIFSGGSFSPTLGTSWKANVQMYSSKILNYLVVRARADVVGQTVRDSQNQPAEVVFRGNNLALVIDLKARLNDGRFVSKLSGLDDQGQPIPSQIPLYCSIQALPR